MTRRLVVECGVMQTRGALIDGAEAVKFWFMPPQGEEKRARAVEDGDYCLARVKSVSKPLAGAFLDVGAGGGAFMPLDRNEKPPVEGASMIVGVRRPSIGSKGPVVSLNWRRGVSVAAQKALEAEANMSDAPRLLGRFADPVVAMARKAAVFGATEIAVDQREGEAALRRAGIECRLDARAVDAADLAGAIDAALAREVAVPGGGRLTFDETEALTAVDVDSASAAETAGGSVNAVINKRAAATLFRELCRRAIGGRVVVDFLPPPASPEKRAAFAASLREIDRDLYPRRAGKLAPDGLFDLTAPRREASLLERATEPAGEDWTRRGRRETIDWRAKAAIFALERELRRAPSAFLELLAAPDLATYLLAEERSNNALLARYGARFIIGEAAKLEERRFEIVSRQTRE